MTSRRYRRPLALVVLWLLLTLLALLYAPRPLVGVSSLETAGNYLRRAFALSPEPTLIVFHHPGGLTLTDQAYVSRKAVEHSAKVHGSDSGETYALSLADGAATVPDLRAGLEDAPDGLESYVTGAAAFAYDGATSWMRARLYVLACLTAIVWVVALFARLGPRRALVICASAGSAGAVASGLAAFVAPPSPVALSAVVSAGLAGAWAVRLLTPHHLVIRANATAAPPPAAAPQSESNPAQARELTPLQRAIVETGEGTLLQVLIIAAGLAGFLFDFRAGVALLIGILVAVAVSLSATPSLIALLTKPRRPRIILGKTGQRWLRLALALLPIASLLLLLAPSAHPANTVSRNEEAAAGYRLLAAAGGTGEDAPTPNRLLPFHLLLQATGVARSEAGLVALQNLVADLNARPGLARVEGATALQQASPAEDEGQLDPAEQTARLAQLEQIAADLEVALNTQASELSLMAADLQNLGLQASDALTADLPEALVETLNETSARLASVSKSLADAQVGLARVPTEFPELAPRMSDVPDLATLSTALDSASANLADVSANLEQAAAQDMSAEQEDPLTNIQEEVDHSLAAIKALAADAAHLRDELAAVEAVWAGAALGDTAPPAPNPYLVSHDLIRLTLIPAGDPYGASALDEAGALIPATRSGLAGSPLADSELTLTGAPAAAAARRSRALESLLAPGVVVAALAVGLFTWGALSHAGLALRLAIGAVLSVVAGVGVASVVLWQMDAGAIALVSVALLALAGGRTMAEPAPTVEALILALPSLCLVLTSVAALTAMGLALSAGLLAAHFLIVPALSYQPPSSGS
jgi:RND superfamily putative drug exporter